MLTNIPEQKYSIEAKISHQPTFTEGLLFLNNCIYESSGLYGQSFLQKTCPNGHVKRQDIAKSYFSEGLTYKDGLLYVLTWKENVGMIYDLNLKYVNSWRYDGEGWGLAWTGKYFILSDGTPYLKIYTSDWKIKNRIPVMNGSKLLSGLNCLLWRDGFIFANVYPTSYIVKIAITSNHAHVINYIDCTNLDISESKKSNPESVVNGICNGPNGTLLVTGKLWDVIYVLNY